MQGGCWNARRTLVNTDELEQAIYMAGHRVLEIQAKLHRWAVDDPHRRFGDLFSLVAGPAFLLVAWNRVRGNKGCEDRRGGWPHGRIHPGAGRGGSPRARCGTR